jgi:hypothetical protein
MSESINTATARRGIIAGLGIILALAVSLTAFAASGNTRNQPSTTGTDGKPTVVLVHGGWDNSTQSAGGLCWSATPTEAP